MEKKFLVGLVGLFILGIVKMSEAVPMYYTFEGAIWDAYADVGWNGPGSEPSDWRNLMVGQPISFTYLIDLESFDIDDPSTHNVELTYCNENFFVNTGMNDENISYAIYHGADEGSICITSSSQYNWTKLGTSESPTNLCWELCGDIISGTSWELGIYLGYDWNVTLTNIAVPVPEPTTMVLLSIGLIGLAGFRKKFKK